MRRRLRPVLETLEGRALMALALDLVPAQFVQEGQVSAVQIQATGAVGQVIYTMAPGSPAGAMVEGATGLFTWPLPSIQERVPITILATDVSGQLASVTFYEWIFDNSPQVSAGPNETLSVGKPLFRVGTFADPDPDTWLATVNYGDGSGVQTLALSGQQFTLSHAYQLPGNYLVTVKVVDSQGGQGYGYFAVSVQDAPPLPVSPPVVTPSPASPGPVPGPVVALAGHGLPIPAGLFVAKRHKLPHVPPKHHHHG